MAQQSQTGRNVRWYAAGSAVGITRMKSLKPDKDQKLEAVKEAGNPDVAEYAKMVPETSISLDYTVISIGQLQAALGLAITAEVPPIPDNFDIVEKHIQPGTEGTTTEIATGWALYQGVMVEKESWDQEVDKLVAVTISGKCKNPRRFQAYNAQTAPGGIHAIQFDKFIGNGSTTAYTLTQKALQLADGFYTIRCETPIGGVQLQETVDYTVSSTSSTTSVTFAVAPASSTAANILVVYVY